MALYKFRIIIIIIIICSVKEFQIIQDGRSGDGECSLAKLHACPWYDVVCALRGAE